MSEPSTVTPTPSPTGTPASSVGVSLTPAFTPSPTATPVPSPSYGNVQQLFRRYQDGTLIALYEQYKPFYGYQYVQNVPSQQWSVPHFKSQVAIYNVFDSNNEMVIPEEIIELDNCNTQILFDAPQAGYANIVFLAGENTGLICTITPTPSVTPTITISPSVTPTMSVSPTISLTPTSTPTPTPTPTATTSPSGVSTYDQVIEADNPLAYWPLNVDLTDVIGGNNLVYEHQNLNYKVFGVSEISGVGLVPDAYGNYAYFDSPNEGLTLTNQISLSSSFTLEAWIELQNFQAAPPSDGFFTIFGTTVYGLQFNSGGTLFMYGNSDAIENSFEIETNTVYHVVLTVDADKNVIFYFNGTPYAGTAQLTEIYVFNYLGTDSDSEYFFGAIGNPAIYNYTLTQQQISNHYSAGTNNYRYANQIILPTPTPTPTGSGPLVTLTPTPTISVTPTPAPPNLFRLLSTGVIDNTYPGINTNFPVTCFNEINDLIYVGGAFSTVNGLTYNDLFRMTSSGAIDTSFVNIVIQNTNQCIYLNPDGHIYIGGGVLYNDGNRGILRLNNDGTVDSTYDVILSGGVAEGVNIILPSSTATGAMLTFGEFTSGNFNDIARLNADGSIDETFTPITLSYSSVSQYIQSIYQIADGHIYVGGQFTSVNGSTSRAYLIRLNSDGSLDETFVDLGLTEDVYAICQGSDGHIYIGGFVNGNVIRLNSDGTLDNTYTSPVTSAPSEIYRTADDKMYVSSVFQDPVIRLNADGSLDTTFVSIGITGAATFYQTLDGNIYVGQ